MTKKIFFYFLLHLFCIHYAQSDFDKIQQSLYENLYIKNYKEVYKIINDQLLSNKDDSRKVIGYVYLFDYYNSLEKEVEKTDALEKAKSLALKTGKKKDLAYVEYGYAKYYLGINRNEQFIKALNNSISIFKKEKNENFILTLLYFLQYKNSLKTDTGINSRTYNIMPYNYAIQSKNTLLKIITTGNLASYYTRQLKSTNNPKYKDSAETLYRKSVLLINDLKNPSTKKRESIVYNLNYASFLKNTDPENQIKRSLEIYQKAIKIIEKDSLYQGYKILAYNNIGTIYELVGDLSKAENYFLKSFELLQQKNDLYAFQKISIIKNLSIWFEDKKDYAKALQYEKEINNIYENEVRKEIENNTKNLEIFYQTEEKNQKIKNLEEINKSHTKNKFLYIGTILLSLTGLVFMIYNYRYRQKLNKQKTEILESEKKEYDLKLQVEKLEKSRLQAEQELLAVKQEQLQKQALATQIQLSHKKSIINDIKEQVKDKNDVMIKKILKEDRLLDEDFEDINKMIQNIHPNFYKSLNELSKTKLSSQDLRYASYIYLNIENQQIANILKVEPKTVRMTKYRLKQKLGLNKDVDLNNFIQNLKIQ